MKRTSEIPVHLYQYNLSIYVLNQKLLIPDAFANARTCTWDLVQHTRILERSDFQFFCCAFDTIEDLVSIVSWIVLNRCFDLTLNVLNN